MGFILSSCLNAFAWNFMTLLIIGGIWKHGLSVSGSLDQSEEETVPFRGASNHVHEDEHSHEDGTCDCNAQGPWQPLFKPSQIAPDDTSELDSSHSSENSIASPSHLQHTRQLPSDLLPPGLAVGERKPKKQNHMIHLHLIPHIYVPVLHPVVHPMTYAHGKDQLHHDRPATQETHPLPTYHSGGVGDGTSAESNWSGEQDSDVGNHNDHERPPLPPSHANGVPIGDDHLHHDLSNHINVHVGDGGGSSDSSHESEETISNVRYPYYPSETYVHHQYEVHEDQPRDPYYENHPSASHTKSQVLAPHPSTANAVAVANVARPSVPAPNTAAALRHAAFFNNRNLMNKKFMNVPITMRQLRVMRPPPLGQKETWVARSSPPLPRFPSKITFDFAKHPFFDFKTNRRLPPTPIVVIPANLIKKRDDRFLKS